MSRFVRPETTTLHLAGGDTLVVKRRLTAGEDRVMKMRGTLVTPEGERRLNHDTIELAIITAYLVDWSLVDDNGRHVDIAGLSLADLDACLNQLHPDEFEAISDVVQRHAIAMREERAQEKKRPAGPMASGSISPSLAAVAGPSTRCVI